MAGTGLMAGTGSSSPAGVLAGPGEASDPPVGWPRHWTAQERLLERQHDRLETQLASLLHQHRPDQPAWDDAQSLNADRRTRRLLWDLRLHLRLEERWLSAQGCLASSHRQAHREASGLALSGFLQSIGDRQARHQWLSQLQSWFNSHRHGADAGAYARATALNTLQSCTQS